MINKFIVIFIVICISFSLISCVKQEFDKFTGVWESKYSKIEITKFNSKYQFKISDKNGENQVEYTDGISENGSIKFDNSKWIDFFKYDNTTKKITWTSKNDKKEYNTELSNVEMFTE